MGLLRQIACWLGRQPRPDRKIRLYQLMRRRGVFVWDPPTSGEARDLAVAMRRCLNCTDKDRCDAFFAAGDVEGHRDFCPNASYLDGLAGRRDG